MWAERGMILYAAFGFDTLRVVCKVGGKGKGCYVKHAWVNLNLELRSGRKFSVVLMLGKNVLLPLMNIMSCK